MNDRQTMEYPIDFVVLWVDDSDPVWQAKKEKYTGMTVNAGSSAARYRDWDTLQYWFRGVEKFAPWVRYVYFVTDDQKPEWLNLEHPKLKWVKHTDFIPKEYLPTFNSNTIDWNLHRIQGLSDRFVYFNDDVFLIKETTPEDFFVNGLPCDLPELGITYPASFFMHTQFNNIELLNKHFSLKNSIQTNPYKWIKGQSMWGLVKLLLYGRKHLIPGMESNHIHISYLKKYFEVLWEQEYERIHATCQNKLRTKEDVSHWCVRNWQLLAGEFYPKRIIGKLFHTATMSYSDDAVTYFKKQKGKVICLNDTEDEMDFELHKQIVIGLFEELLPNKSSFEK